MKRFYLSALIVGGHNRMPDQPDAAGKPTASSRDWREYLGGPDRNHHFTLKQITPENVANLKVAWEYHTLDSGEVKGAVIKVTEPLLRPISDNPVFLNVTVLLFRLLYATSAILYQLNRHTVKACQFLTLLDIDRSILLDSTCLILIALSYLQSLQLPSQSQFNMPLMVRHVPGRHIQ